MARLTKRQKLDRYWAKKEIRHGRVIGSQFREELECRAYVPDKSYDEALEDLEFEVDTFFNELCLLEDLGKPRRFAKTSRPKPGKRRPIALRKQVHLVEFVEDLRHVASRGSRIDWAQTVQAWNAGHPHHQYLDSEKLKASEILMKVYHRAATDPDVQREYMHRKPLRDARKYNDLVAWLQTNYAFAARMLGDALHPIEVDPGDRPTEVTEKINKAYTAYTEALLRLSRIEAKTAEQR